jgi:hypothetical protein
VINWWHVFLSYVPMALTVAVVLLAIQLAPLLSSVDVAAVKTQTVSALSHSVSMWPLVGTILMLFYLFVHFRSRPVYLLDFACFDPPESWQVSHEGDFASAVPLCRRPGRWFVNLVSTCVLMRAGIMKAMAQTKKFSQESLDFLARMLSTGNTGPNTHWPPYIVKFQNASGEEPFQPTMEEARQEAEAGTCCSKDCVLL